MLGRNQTKTNINDVPCLFQQSGRVHYSNKSLRFWCLALLVGVRKNSSHLGECMFVACGGMQSSLLYQFVKKWKVRVCIVFKLFTHQQLKKYKPYEARVRARNLKQQILGRKKKKISAMLGKTGTFQKHTRPTNSSETPLTQSRLLIPPVWASIQ